MLQSPWQLPLSSESRISSVLSLKTSFESLHALSAFSVLEPLLDYSKSRRMLQNSHDYQRMWTTTMITIHNKGGASPGSETLDMDYCELRVHSITQSFHGHVAE